MKTMKTTKSYLDEIYKDASHNALFIDIKQYQANENEKYLKMLFDRIEKGKGKN